jgi:hypothetical protein
MSSQIVTLNKELASLTDGSLLKLAQIRDELKQVQLLTRQTRLLLKTSAFTQVQTGFNSHPKSSSYLLW